MLQRKFIILAATLGAFAVILGAFGAHALKAQLSETRLGIFQTGITYHYYHTLAILMTSLLIPKNPRFKWAIYLFLIGILFFSGSLYLLATRELLGIESLTPILGPITPIGGLFFILAWTCVGFAAWEIKDPD